MNGKSKWSVWKDKENEWDLTDGIPAAGKDPEELGEPLEEFETEPGDLVYMPRGLIQSTLAGSDESSIQATFRVNRDNSAAHWFNANMATLLNNIAEDNPFLRYIHTKNLGWRPPSGPYTEKRATRPIALNKRAFPVSLVIMSGL